MENKTTTELLDLLEKLIDKDGNLQDGWQEAFDELLSREPFYSLYKPIDDSTLAEELKDIREEIKLLKRHKHEEKSGNVMIRI